MTARTTTLPSAEKVPPRPHGVDRTARQFILDRAKCRSERLWRLGLALLPTTGKLLQRLGEMADTLRQFRGEQSPRWSWTTAA